MKLLKKHFDNLFKECKHRDDKTTWLNDKFNAYFEQNKN